MDHHDGAAAMTTRPPRFFVTSAPEEGDRITLAVEETHHARVRRIARGDTITLFDGHGRSYIGVVDRSAKKQLEVTIEHELPVRVGESPLAITLAIAMLKSDRLEWIIEKATELGVARIRPFLSAHSLAQPSASRRERWRAIALSAAKQCGRSVVPCLDPPCNLGEILSHTDSCRLLYWEGARADPATLPDSVAHVTLMIGPEGGFAEGEVEQARRVGCIITSLGPRILRAETAAVAAIALAQSAWGDLPHQPCVR